MVTPVTRLRHVLELRCFGFHQQPTLSVFEGLRDFVLVVITGLYVLENLGRSPAVDSASLFLTVGAPSHSRGLLSCRTQLLCESLMLPDQSVPNAECLFAPALMDNKDNTKDQVQVELSVLPSSESPAISNATEYRLYRRRFVGIVGMVGRSPSYYRLHPSEAAYFQCLVLLESRWRYLVAMVWAYSK